MTLILYRAFDVELLYIAQQLSMPVAEVGVNWKEIEGLRVIVSMVARLLISLPLPPSSPPHPSL